MHRGPNELLERLKGTWTTIGVVSALMVVSHLHRKSALPMDVFECMIKHYDTDD